MRTRKKLAVLAAKSLTAHAPPPMADLGVATKTEFRRFVRFDMGLFWRDRNGIGQVLHFAARVRWLTVARFTK